jgi:hypothetical protein
MACSRQSGLAIRRIRAVCAVPYGPQIPAYIGTVVAITLLAWAIGCSESQW